MNINGHKLEIGDVIDSNFIGKIGQSAKWEVIEIIRRFDFKGTFERDMTDCGFEVIVQQ